MNSEGVWTEEVSVFTLKDAGSRDLRSTRRPSEKWVGAWIMEISSSLLLLVIGYWSFSTEENSSAQTFGYSALHFASGSAPVTYK